MMFKVLIEFIYDGIMYSKFCLPRDFSPHSSLTSCLTVQKILKMFYNYQQNHCYQSRFLLDGFFFVEQEVQSIENSNFKSQMCVVIEEECRKVIFHHCLLKNRWGFLFGKYLFTCKND